MNDMPYDRDYDNNWNGQIDCNTMDRINKGIQAHSAPLGLTFLQDTAFPLPYRGGVVVGLHGSWNRSTKTGYKVIFFPWNTTQQIPGDQVDLVNGWLDAQQNPWGRPVDMAVNQQGEMYISDDHSGTIYRLYLSYGAPTAAPVQISPSGVNNGSLTPAYRWNPVSTANVYTFVLYDFTVTPAALKRLDVVNGLTACTPTCSYTPAGPTAALTNGGIYAWWVIPGNEAGNGPWSTGAAFAMFSKPANPQMIAPSAGSTQAGTPMYRWNRVAGATFYVVFVLRASDAAVMFNQSILASTCTTDLCQVSQAPALAAGSYISGTSSR